LGVFTNRRIALVALLAACSGDASAPETELPTAVVIVAATPTMIQLRNDGGAGTFKIEVWGRIIGTAPTGCFISEQIEGHCPVTPTRITETDPVTVTASYDEALSVTIDRVDIYAYRVYSRAVNTAVWAQSDCRKAVEGAWVKFTC
jgi:hypothetical protein